MGTQLEFVLQDTFDGRVIHALDLHPDDSVVEDDDPILLIAATVTNICLDEAAENLFLGFGYDPFGYFPGRTWVMGVWRYVINPDGTLDLTNPNTGLVGWQLVDVSEGATNAIAEVGGVIYGRTEAYKENEGVLEEGEPIEKQVPATWREMEVVDTSEALGNFYGPPIDEGEPVHQGHATPLKPKYTAYVGTWARGSDGNLWFGGYSSPVGAFPSYYSPPPVAESPTTPSASSEANTFHIYELTGRVVYVSSAVVGSVTQLIMRSHLTSGGQSQGRVVGESTPLQIIHPTEPIRSVYGGINSVWINGQFPDDSGDGEFWIRRYAIDDFSDPINSYEGTWPINIGTSSQDGTLRYGMNFSNETGHGTPAGIYLIREIEVSDDEGGRPPLRQRQRDDLKMGVRSPSAFNRATSQQGGIRARNAFNTYR